jgi:putative transposase
MKSATSAQGSTSSDRVFYEYWDSSKKDVYQKLLWLPETGSRGLVSSSLNGFAPSTGPKSSFSTIKTEPPRKSLETISCPSYKFTVVDGMEGVAAPKLKSLKLKLNPTGPQKEKLAQMAGCCRFTYNQAVAMALAKDSTHRDVFRIRDRIVTKKQRGAKNPNNFFNNKPWLLECPKSTRQKAVASAVANIKACFSNLKAGNITHFTAPFKRKKKEMQNGWTVEMEQLNVVREGDQLYIFKDILGEMRYFGTRQLRKLMPGVHPTHDCKVQKSAFGEYFLVLSVDVERRARAPLRARLKANDDGTVSLSLVVFHDKPASAAIDPGVRKTLVTYSPENRESFMIGKGQAKDIVELLIQYDKFQSDLSNADAKDTKAIKRKMRALRKRIFYLKKEFRDQTANFLARRYDIILMPKLDTGALSIKVGRRLKTKVVRQMLTLGHSSIFTRIREKCQEYGTQFMEVMEDYTSKTCVQCGHLHKCGETYVCKNCGFTCDRDIAGAAGIFLKAVRTTDPLSGSES